ncbi:MAG TPA: DoxX family protein [Thermoanaerobaculia bacterium]
MTNLILWIVQVFLALFFIGAGIPKITGRGLEQWIGFSNVPRPLTIAIGIAEVLGAVGLVLPMATGILPWLTPLAAIGLAINVLMASGFHIRADERLNAIETTIWAGIAAIIAIGRWYLVRVAIPPWILAAALTVMVPAAIILVIVLLRRPARIVTN